jgi:hypothetical protein
MSATLGTHAFHRLAETLLKPMVEERKVPVSQADQRLVLAKKKKGAEVVLLILIVLVAVTLLTDVLGLMVNGETQAVVSTISGLVAIVAIFAIILLLILYCVWVFAFHGELARIDPSYLVKPGGAIARILIPGYNLWGIWNIHGSYGRWLQGDLDEGRKASGSLILRLLPLFYACLIVGQVFDRIAARSGSSPWIGMAGSLFSVAYLSIWLKLVNTMQKALPEEARKEDTPVPGGE